MPCFKISKGKEKEEKKKEEKKTEMLNWKVKK